MKKLIIGSTEVIKKQRMIARTVQLYSFYMLQILIVIIIAPSFSSFHKTIVSAFSLIPNSSWISSLISTSQNKQFLHNERCNSATYSTFQRLTIADSYPSLWVLQDRRTRSSDHEIDEYDTEEEEEEAIQESPPWNPFNDDVNYNSNIISPDMVTKLTVTQLRQQLRLRGMKTSGKKSELIERLLGMEEEPNSSNNDENYQSNFQTPIRNGVQQKSKARIFAESNGKTLIDVTEYLDEKDKGKETKTFTSDESEDDDYDPDSSGEEKNSSPETWGDEARIVEDYEGRSLIVDGLSRTVVEFVGSNRTKVQAYVVASHESLKAYLAGGKHGLNITDPELMTKNIQLARERAAKVPLKIEDVQGVDQDDEEGYYTNVVERDYGDWGKFSGTGAQISAQEVKGVLLLPDVYGPFTEYTKALADKIAFECQPVVVFVPDLFRGKPWKNESSSSGNSYEEWRASHSDHRVHVDIRSAAATLRSQYNVNSVSIFGTCYGGGKALEVTAQVYPDGNPCDVNGNEGPPDVNPCTCVVWYPTRYNAELLFGEKSLSSKQYETAVMAVFAGDDDLKGATAADAALLKKCLENDNRVKDHMVKVFPGQKHGFAHMHLAEMPLDEDDFLQEEFGGVPTRTLDSGDAEVASLLSTAFMETYARVFLPTVGSPVKDDESWSDLEMPIENKRDVRQEIEKALENHEDVDLDLERMHPDDFKTPIDDLEGMDDDLMQALQTKLYGFSLEDDVDTFLEKLQGAIDRDDFSYTPGFGEIPLDDSGEAYW